MLLNHCSSQFYDVKIASWITKSYDLLGSPAQHPPPLTRLMHCQHSCLGRLNSRGPQIAAQRQQQDPKELICEIVQGQRLPWIYPLDSSWLRIAIWVTLDSTI